MRFLRIWTVNLKKHNDSKITINFTGDQEDFLRKK